MNILLVTYSFPPLNVISTYRILHWAKYWASNGHFVTVLTTRKYGFEGPLDLDYEFSDNISIVEVDYLPFLLKRVLKRSKSKINGKKSGNQYQRNKVVNFIFPLIKKLLGTFADPSIFSIKYALKAGIEVGKNKRYDLIVSSYGPAASHIVASKLSEMLDTKWLADYRDLWSLNHLNKSIGIVRQIEKIYEKKILKNAFACTGVSSEMVKQISDHFGKKSYEINNGYDPEEYEFLSTISKSCYFSDNYTHISYAGLIYPGRRDPTPLFETIVKHDLADKVRVHFYGNKLGGVEKLVVNLNLSKTVIFHGYKPRNIVLRELSSADGLLFLESGKPDAAGVLTGKIFEYIALRKPILSLGIKNYFQSAQLIKDGGIGLVTEDKHEEILKFLLDPNKYFNPNTEKLYCYNRKLQANKLLSIVDYD